jgi:hypothetical protein
MRTGILSCWLPALYFVGAFSATALDVPFDEARDISGPFGNVRSVTAADIDKDGRNDVVGASFADDEIAWWRNIDESGTNWAKTLIAPAYTGATFVLTVDLDRDGDLDVLAAGGQAGANVVLFENVPGDGTAWTPRTIKDSFSGDHRSLAVADIDCDGDLDVAGAGSDTNAVVWWQNPGQLGSAWIERLIQANFANADSRYRSRRSPGCRGRRTYGGGRHRLVAQYRDCRTDCLDTHRDIGGFHSTGTRYCRY